MCEERLKSKIKGLFEQLNDDFHCDSVTDPIGSNSGTKRAIRGGGIINNKEDCRCSSCFAGETRNQVGYFCTGFRLALTE